MTLARARSDWQRFSSGDEWSTPIQISPPGGSFVTVDGLAIKHHLSIDTDGSNINSQNAHCTISEALMVAAGLTVRDAQNVVAMNDFLLKYTDSTGTEGEYVIKQAFPDETVGMITFILGNYGNP